MLAWTYHLISTPYRFLNRKLTEYRRLVLAMLVIALINSLNRENR